MVKNSVSIAKARQNTKTNFHLCRVEKMKMRYIDGCHHSRWEMTDPHRQSLRKTIESEVVALSASES